MGKQTNIPWARISAEAVAIVGSILLAFAIDAWWDEQKDRELEQQLLASLIVEFEGTAVEFDAQWARHEQRLAAATQLAELNEESARQLGTENLKHLWLQAYTISRSDPPEGALTSAIAAGSISLIRNEELKSRLTGWKNQLADLRHTEFDMAYYMTNIMVPEMSSRVLLPLGSATSTSDFGDALLAIPTKNHMNVIAFVTGIAQDENEQMQEEVAKIRELLLNEVTP